MESLAFAPAVRRNTPVIIGICGASGSGKTFSGLELATGLAGGGKVALIDTEGRRSLIYADLPGENGQPRFVFDHCDFESPYTPQRFLQALQAAESAGYAVVIVDNFSDEYTGEGGLVDMAGEEEKRVRNAAAAWAKPKSFHKLVIRWLRQSRCHVIFLMRAQEKVKLEKVVRDGREQTLVVPIGWQPVCERNVPYDMTVSFLLVPEAPGEPQPIKLPEQLKAFFPLGRQITRESGRQLRAWCDGGAAAKPAAKSAPKSPAKPRGRMKPDIADYDTSADYRSPAASAEISDKVLLAQAYDAAAGGTLPLRVFWEETLAGTGKRALLKGVLEKYLKPMAEAADAKQLEATPEESPGGSGPPPEPSVSVDFPLPPGDAEEAVLERVE
jgi:hypothetical protein